MVASAVEFITRWIVSPHLCLHIKNQTAHSADFIREKTAMRLCITPRICLYYCAITVLMQGWSPSLHPLLGLASSNYFGQWIEERGSLMITVRMHLSLNGLAAEKSEGWLQISVYSVVVAVAGWSISSVRGYLLQCCVVCCTQVKWFLLTLGSELRHRSFWDCAKSRNSCILLFFFYTMWIRPLLKFDSTELHNS